MCLPSEPNTVLSIARATAASPSPGRRSAVDGRGGDTGAAQGGRPVRESQRYRLLQPLLLALVLLGAACGYHGPASGAVEKRIYCPAHVETGYTMICGAYGKYGCTAWIPIPFEHNIPDSWYLTITSCADDNRRDHCQRGSFEVTQATYDNVSVGSVVSYKAVKK